MWLSKMFFIISNKDRVRAGAKLREKNPGWRLWGFVLLFKNFSLLFFCTRGGEGSHRREARRNYNPWFRLSYTGKDNLPVQSPCQKGNNNNNNNNKKNPNPLGIMHRLHYVSQDQPSVRIPAVDIPGLSGCM